jgi:DtxR family Mn-dependent transcriptional regulator
MSETAAVQDYLKAIYQLGGEASTTDVAVRLGVRSPSATAMLRRLADLGLATYEPYRGVRLTDRGLRGALKVIRHHRLLETYLTQVVGLSWDEVHDEAEVLEHVLSEKLEARLDELLGFPTHDPHGDPIPSPALVLQERHCDALSGLHAGMIGVVRRVSDRDPALLRHLAEVGLAPGARVDVIEVVPYGGGIRMRVDGVERHVGIVAADAVFVSEEGVA